VAASAAIVALFYPLFEGMIWGDKFGLQKWFEATFGAKFADFAGSVVVHTLGGWMALSAVLLLGARRGRYRKDGSVVGIPPSNIPLLALGAWVLTVGWFGFNVMSAQKVADITGLVAVNSLMAMAGGLLAATIAGKKDPGFVHNGPLAGLVAVCHRRRRRRDFRVCLQRLPEPLENRRRFGRVAAAWALRTVGRHRLRDFRRHRSWRTWRREFLGAARRHAGRRGLCRRRRRHRLRASESVGRHPPHRRGGA
jgi:hypothetical protein